MVNYPIVRREAFKETLFGHEVHDPYRWLEDPDSEETKKFVTHQNELFNSTIKAYPRKEALSEYITDLYNYEKFSCPFKEGNNFYYFYNPGLLAQSKLEETGTPFFDANELSKEGTCALSTYEFSKSGKYFAHGLSFNGSDWVTIGVQDNQKKKLDDKIEWAKFTGISWTHDERGFFYTRYPKPEIKGDAGTETGANVNSKIYYHVLGTSQDQDSLVYEEPENPSFILSGGVTDDGNYLLITISNSCEPVNKVYIQHLNDKKYEKGAIIKVVDHMKGQFSYVANDGDLFYFKTNLESLRYKIVTLNLKDSSIEDHVAESSSVLDSAFVSHHDKLILVYMENVMNKIFVHNLVSGKRLYELPIDIGSVDSASSKRDYNLMFFNFSSFLNPGMTFKVDFAGDSKPVLFRKTNIKCDSSDLETVQQWYPSHDGQKIPMFVVKKKGAVQCGPLFLYGYGGFSVSLSPWFSPFFLALNKFFNMTVVIANIRGGGEFGEDWHHQGTVHKKMNGFLDFRYAAKFLIKEGYTKPEKLAINGGSNGGLLVAAVTLQEPELFGCAIADVGVLDMLRFHKFTIGYAWKSDYGDPDTKEDFEYLIKYSPVHNVSKKVYPSVLLTTSDHDDRVVPLHSYKMISSWQYAAPDNPNPILIRIETNAGHGAGKSTQKRIEEAVDKFSFMALSLGLQ